MVHHTQLATGSLILLLGGFAPWAAIKMFHFTGDALHSAHATAEGQRDLHVDHRVARQHSGWQRLLDALAHRRNEFLRDNATLGRVDELEALARLLRLDLQNDVAVLALARSTLALLIRLFMVMSSALLMATP